MVDERIAEIGEGEPAQAGDGIVRRSARPARMASIIARSWASSITPSWQNDPVSPTSTHVASGHDERRRHAADSDATANRVPRAVRHVHRTGTAHTARPRPLRTGRASHGARRARRRQRRRGRRRFRADRELDRGDGQLHARRARLRPRAADRRARWCSTSTSAWRRAPASASRTSRRSCRSRSPPPNATATCASSCPPQTCAPRPPPPPRRSSSARTPAPHLAAIAPRIAAERYGLDVLAENIEDHAENQTRFVLVRRSGIPTPTGHDRTALVVYQRADEPGSLISILQEFAARRLNLSNLISRPTKEGGLGDYCFIIFADGHVADDLVADAMRALHAKQAVGEVLRVVAAGRSPRARRPRPCRRALAAGRRLDRQISATVIG